MQISNSPLLDRNDFTAFRIIGAGEEIFTRELTFFSLPFYQRTTAVRADLNGFGIVGYRLGFSRFV